MRPAKSPCLCASARRADNRWVVICCSAFGPYPDGRRWRRPLLHLQQRHQRPPRRRPLLGPNRLQHTVLGRGRRSQRLERAAPALGAARVRLERAAALGAAGRRPAFRRPAGGGYSTQPAVVRRGAVPAATTAARFLRTGLTERLSWGCRAHRGRRTTAVLIFAGAQWPSY